MKTMAATLRRELARSGADIRRRVTININTDDGTEFSFVTGAYPIGDYPNSVASVTPSEHSIDPWTREPSINNRSVTFTADGAIREIVRDYTIVGKELEIFIGTPDTPEADWIQDFRGVISNYTSEPDGSYVVSAEDAKQIMKETPISGTWENMHPLAILTDLYTQSDVPNFMWDDASLDYTNYEDISHWNLFRGSADPGGAAENDSTVTEDTNAWDLALGLLWMLGGTIRTAADGADEWIPYDPDRVVDRHWDRNMVSNFRMLDSGLHRNRVNCTYYPQGENDDIAMVQHRAVTFNDEAAQEAAAFANGTARVLQDLVDTGWMRTADTINSSLPTGQYFVHMSSAKEWGFSGARWQNTGGAQETIDMIRADLGRRSIFLINNEFIEVDLFGSDTGHPGVVEQDGVYATADWFQISLRGVFGTTEATHASGDFVFDVTIAAAIAQRELDRHSRGAPIVEFDVPISELDTQLGDFVTVDANAYTRLGVDGADETVVFEVTKVIVNDGESPPHVHIEACWARDD